MMRYGIFSMRWASASRGSVSCIVAIWRDTGRKSPI